MEQELAKYKELVAEYEQMHIILGDMLEDCNYETIEDEELDGWVFNNEKYIRQLKIIYDLSEQLGLRDAH